MLKIVLPAALIIGFATPALADFYVVQDAKTKKCTVVKEKPTTSTVTVLGDGTVFKTENEAEAYEKKTKVCTTE